MSKLLNELHSRMSKNTKYIEFCMNKKSNDKYIKRKSWWDIEMENLHKEICNKYENYINSNIQDENLRVDLKISKTKFRKNKRLKINEKRKQCIIDIDRLAKYNRIKFWREMKKMQNNKVESELKPDFLKETFKKLFSFL